MDNRRAIDPMNPKNSRRTQPGERSEGSDHFAAPLGSSASGRLRFTNGVHRSVIRADLHLLGLYHAHFGDQKPMVSVQGGVVTIRYPRILSCDWLSYRSERPGEVALNAHIPWDIEVRDGASRLVADLRELRLGSFNLDGGASRVEVVLPAPSGTVAVAILGGASNVAIRRPEGIAAQLRVSGGVTNLKFDDRHIGAAGGELDLRAKGYDGATDRYGVVITGGVNNVRIDKQRAARDRGSGASA